MESLILDRSSLKELQVRGDNVVYAYVGKKSDFVKGEGEEVLKCRAIYIGITKNPLKRIWQSHLNFNHRRREEKKTILSTRVRRGRRIENTKRHFDIRRKSCQRPSFPFPSNEARNRLLQIVFFSRPEPPGQLVPLSDHRSTKCASSIPRPP